jgi:hypothetical protein
MATMTAAEMTELLNVKRNMLEAMKATGNTAVLKALEGEIKELEGSLAKANAPKRERKVFLDECAG